MKCLRIAQWYTGRGKQCKILNMGVRRLRWRARKVRLISERMLTIAVLQIKDENSAKAEKSMGMGDEGGPGSHTEPGPSSLDVPYAEKLFGLSSRPVLKIHSINQSVRLCMGFYRSDVNRSSGCLLWWGWLWPEESREMSYDLECFFLLHIL